MEEGASTVGRDAYVVSDPARFDQFLDGNVSLLSLLLEAPARIQRRFGRAPLHLDVVDDPDGESDTLLVLRIVASQSPEKAVENLEKLDAEWWLDAMTRAHGRLCIKVDYP